MDVRADGLVGFGLPHQTIEFKKDPSLGGSFFFVALTLHWRFVRLPLPIWNHCPGSAHRLLAATKSPVESPL